MDDIKYAFDRLFQIRILTQMVLDPSLLKQYRDILDSSFFEQEDTENLARLVLDYFDRYHMIPDQETLFSLIVDYSTTMRLKTEAQKALVDLLNKVYSNSLEHGQFIIDKIRPFGRRQVLKKSMLEVAPLIDDLENNEDLIRKKMFEALQAGAGIDQERVDLTSSWDTLPTRYREFNESDTTGRIPVGISELDATLDGGLGMFELGMLEALPGKGKSRMMVNFGIVAHLMRKNVLFITNELHKLDVELMCSCRWSGLTAKQIKNVKYADKYQQLMATVMGSTPAFFEVAYYPPFRMGISTLRALISKIENIKGEHVDIIILDMFDRIGGMDPKNPWTSQYFLLKELMALVADFNTRMWTTTHVKHSGYDAEILDMQHSGGSVAKPQDIDIMLSLNQTEKQEESMIAYINCAKVRRSAVGNKRKKVYFDKARCLMLSWDDWYKMQLGKVK